MRIVMPGANRRTAALTTLLLIAAAASAPAASAKTPAPPPRLPTQTVLTSSASSVNAGGSVTITAALHPGILVTASGSVTFADATTGAGLGTAKPATRCLLTFKPCVVTLSVPASSLAAGANTITGTYSGDVIEAPSSGSVIVTLNGSDPTQVTTCSSGSTECVTNNDFSDDGTAEASIAVFGSAAQTETISLSFQTAELPCSTPNTGDPVVFSSMNAAGEKFVNYSVYGTPADIANAAYGADGNVCYESPSSFTTAGGTPATLGADGLYAGILPSCGDGAPPCSDGASFQAGGSDDGPSVDEYTESFIVTAADPRASN